MNQIIWQQQKVILVQQRRRNTRRMMLIGQLVQVDVLSLLMVLLVVFTVQQVPYHFVISIRHTTNNHIHIRRDTIKKMVQSNLSTTNYKKYSNNMVNIISPTTPLQKIILLFYCTVPSRHYNRIMAQSDTKSKPITDPTTSTTAILCRGGGGGGHNNDTGFYCNDTDPNRSTSIYLQYDNYTQQNKKIIDGQCGKVEKYEYGSYEIGSLLTKNNYYDDSNVYKSMTGDEEYENDEFYYEDDEEFVDDDDDEDDDGDYECENDDQYSTSQYTSSNTSLSTMFHPPSIQLNDMVSALLYTCTMNHRLQQFVMVTKQNNVLYNQQRLLMQKYNRRPGINITSSSSFRFLPTSRLVTNTPQRLLRGGSSSSSSSSSTSNSGMTLSQVEQNAPIQFSSSSSYHDQKNFKTLYNYYKLPITTMSENDKHHHRDICSTNDIWTTKSISLLHSSTQSNLVEQKQLLNYLHLLVRDVLDIMTEDDNDDHRTNLSGGDSLSNNMPKSIDSIRQLQSNLELTLSMIYLDRACSVVTARNNNKQTNVISACPPCTVCTIHRLVLASLLLSVSSVRRISVDDIVQSKFVQLSKLLQLHGIIRINESYPSTTTSTSNKQDYNSSTSIDIHPTDDDIKQLQRIINDMVQSFKHALGDCGIFVTMEEMKDFRQIWEKSFGPSSQSSL